MDSEEPTPRRPWPLRLAWRLIKLGAGLGALGALAFWALTLYLDARLPDVLTVADYWRTAPQLSRVLAADGSEVGVFRDQRRTLVRLDALPPHLPAALVASEDEDFYRHEGLDWVGMARAMVVNIKDGRLSQGASTITQQLARSFYLTADKTLERKLLEVFLARKLDRHLDKDEILELYLNQVYFGRGRYGVEEAARHYFGKGASALTLAESASLVGLLPRPERLNPRADLRRHLDRRARVLERMGELGLAEAASVRDAVAEPIRLAPDARDPDAAPWFSDLVRRRLEGVLSGPTLRTGGFEIFTTLDPRVQRAVDAAVARAAPTLGGAQVAVVALDPRTREVRALCGGLDFAASPFNRAVQAHRQAGSTFKPFVYAAGIERGTLSAESTYPNRRVSYPGRRGRWRPANADGRHDGRQVTVREALARSLNVVAVQALEDVGVGALTDLARRVGVSSPIPADLTAALGSATVTPLELANAYATFASGGVAGTPVVVRRVEDAAGHLVHAERAEPRRALSARVAAEVTELLRAVVAEGTARRARVAGLEVAGKTGTTDDSRDAWFVGYTDRLVIAVWVGRDDGGPMRRRTGGDTAAPIFADVLRALGSRQTDPGVRGEDHKRRSPGEEPTVGAVGP